MRCLLRELHGTQTRCVDKKQSYRILRHEVLYKYPLTFKKYEIDGDETGH